MELKKIDLKKFPTVVFTGDIHGLFRAMVSSLLSQYGYRDTIVVVCGDIGMGFYKRGYYTDEFRWMQNRLEKQNVTVVMLRGNHDQPCYFSDPDYSEFQYGGSYPNAFLVPDYTILETSKGNVLCIGGAISIDRSARTESISWWPDEKFVMPSEELYNQLSKEDLSIVATHTCPKCCGPLFNDAMGYEQVDRFIMSELQNERLDLLEVFENLKESHSITHWLYGHFHGHYSDDFNGTRFVGLDMLRNRGADIYELREA